MMHVFPKWLYLMALVIWLGAVVFFSFVTAPSLFRTFDAPQAGRAVGGIFPTYYRLGYVCGAVLLASSLMFLAAGTARVQWGASSLLAAAMLAATLYAGLVIQPRATQLRPQIHEAGAPQAVKDEFSRLHRLAVTLNGAVLLCGIGLTVITATKLQP
jgi:uncharacterized membrane protein